MSSVTPELYGVLFQPAPEFDKDTPEDSTAAIRIMEPEFKGVVVRYNTIKFVEDDKKENVVLKFDYNIIEGEVPDHKKADFEVTLGNLLYDIILTSLSSSEA